MRSFNPTSPGRSAIAYLLLRSFNPIGQIPIDFLCESKLRCCILTSSLSMRVSSCVVTTVWVLLTWFYHNVLWSGDSDNVLLILIVHTTNPISNKVHLSRILLINEETTIYYVLIPRVLSHEESFLLILAKRDIFHILFYQAYQLEQTIHVYRPIVYILSCSAIVRHNGYKILSLKVSTSTSYFAFSHTNYNYN